MDHIAKDNVVATLEIDERIASAVDHLLLFPEMGRLGRVIGTRELVVAKSDFLVAYKLDEGRGNIVILRVIYGAQRWPETFATANKTFVLAPQSGGGARRAEGALCYRQRAGGKRAPLRRFAPPPPLCGARTGA
jgi:toxin ParE1/3/4